MGKAQGPPPLGADPWASPMAMAKKGTRRITVDGTAYRWVASPNDGYIDFVAELADAPGWRMEASFRYHDVYDPRADGSWRIVGQRRTVGPAAARAVILAALARGWRPDTRNPRPFRVEDADELVPVSG